MRNKELYNIYINIGNSNNPMYQYISYYLTKRKNYKCFLNLYNKCLILKNNNFPFEKINLAFFNIINEYCGNELLLTWDFFNNLYLEKNYDSFANFLLDMSYSYIFLDKEDQLKQANPEFYSLFNTYTDILEMIRTYVGGNDAVFLEEIAVSLLAVEWIDGTKMFNQTYRKMMNLLERDISIADFCLLCGINVNVITTEKALFIAKEIKNYSKSKRVEF